jgi:opacity protein-like surface antigen
VGLRYTSETLDGNTMDAAGLNIGFQKALLPNWTVAAAVNNLTIRKAKATFSDALADLPTEIRVGVLNVSLLNKRQLNLSFDLVKSNDSDIKIGFGAQYNLISNLDVRAGYNTVSDISPVSLGIGLKMSHMNVDFSYLPSDDFGPSYRIGLGLEL